MIERILIRRSLGEFDTASLLRRLREIPFAAQDPSDDSVVIVAESEEILRIELGEAQETGHFFSYGTPSIQVGPQYVNITSYLAPPESIRDFVQWLRKNQAPLRFLNERHQDITEHVDDDLELLFGPRRLKPAPERVTAAQRLTESLEEKLLEEICEILDGEVGKDGTTKRSIAIPDPTDPELVRDQAMQVYDFTDGTTIRIKPKGDLARPGAPIFAVGVCAPDCHLPGPQCIEHWVKWSGTATPKDPADVVNPYDPITEAAEWRAFWEVWVEMAEREDNS